MKTYTPILDAAVLVRLRDYAALFAVDFPQAKPARWAGGTCRASWPTASERASNPSPTA